MFSVIVCKSIKIHHPIYLNGYIFIHVIIQ